MVPPGAMQAAMPRGTTGDVRPARQGESSMRIIGYLRVSTLLQADEGVSLDAQRERIAGWARSAGAELDQADVFVDAGVSGKRADNRPALQAALDAVCSCRGALVVYSLSRLARSVRDTLVIAERLDKAGADLVSLTERIETTSASGKMVFRMLSVLNEFERDLVSERTRSAVAYKRARGERVSGVVPYGSALGEDGRTLVPDPAELAAIGDVRRWHAGGWTLRRMAAELQARGLPTRSGRPWSFSSVRDILKRPA
jgi:site-specific DNA recombinase